MEKIIIYGAGKRGRQYYNFLNLIQEKNIIYAFCDKNYKQIEKIESIPVYPYCELKDKGLPFVIGVSDGKELYEMLQEDNQICYKNLEDWIRNVFGENERIKMLAAYRGINLTSEMWEVVWNEHLDKAIRIYGGICPCCEEKTLFISYHYWLRDHYKCLFCGSIPRQRALMKVLKEEIPDWKRVKIHESSPSAGSTFNIFKQECEQYTYSQWYENKSQGEVLGENFTNQNLEELTFADETFDVFITQDVLEHVNYPERALREIARTLKKGGVHIFTTPIYLFRKTRARIKMKGNERELILPPIYHGNPISAEGSLVTYEWGGNDFLEIIDDITGMKSRIVCFPNSEENFKNGLEADFLQVIVSQK